MTALPLTGAGETADLGAFLARLIRWDKAAIVRLQAGGGVLAVFGRPPFGGVLAVRTAGLAAPVECDATVSAGQLLDAIDAAGGGPVPIPASVTGPAWTGLLPPRGGWHRVADLAPADVQTAAAHAVAEFRQLSEALVPARRTRAELDALADEIWSRPLGPTPLPVRAVHAAHALGFLRTDDEPLALLAAGPWLRLRTPYGSVVVRRTNGPSLSVTPA